MQKTAYWPAVLLVTAVLVVALLCTAAWRLMQQEQAFDRQRLRERLETAASLVVRESERALAQSAADERTSLSIRWDERGLHRTGGVPLLWSPMPELAAEAPQQLFAKCDELEFAKSQPEQAITECRTLLSNSNATVRAGALLRIARCQKKLNRPAEALETYARLAAMGTVQVAGAPAVLVGTLERIGLLSDPADERAKLKSVLERGEHHIDRTTFEFYAREIPLASDAWAEAVVQLWKRAADTTRGTTILAVGGRRFVAEWSREGQRGTGRLVDYSALQSRLSAALNGAYINWRLMDESDGGAGMLTKRPSETGLPWGVQVSLPPETAPMGGTLLVSGIVVLGLAIMGALCLAYRAVRRELQVAGMQSEFVAAVSHEFRTPLTALTHLTDLLESDGVTEDRRQLYYRALGRETRRLRDMVENLLDFGRIEAGRYKYKPEELDAVEFVRALVDEFRDQPLAGNHELVFDGDSGRLPIAADREAMRRAVWNLLDNAAKYSPAGTRITTQVAAADGWTAVSVQDEGPGIAREERRRIFQKFVRGRTEAAEQVRGTGIGLAMVDAIVRAHGGRVELQSQPGAGSRFTVLLPPERRP